MSSANGGFIDGFQRLSNNTKFGSLPVSPQPGAKTPLEKGFQEQADEPKDKVAKNKDYIVIVVDLAVARNNVLLNVGFFAEFFWAVDSTSDTTRLFIAPGNGDSIPFRPGTKINFLRRVDRLYFTNEAQAGETMTLVIAANSPSDNIQTDS